MIMHTYITTHVLPLYTPPRKPTRVWWKWY